MIFVYKAWADFCDRLGSSGMHSIPACSVSENAEGYLVLKHDVETNVSSAYRMAEIENAYGHCGSYYVQAYLLQNEQNVALLRKMQQMGHEISYHHDVMDSCKGDMDAAIAEFEKNCKLFEQKGFHVVTVCQHGNPVVERTGYTSNRDFFRDERVQMLYPAMADIMVDFLQKYNTKYLYYSDAGRIFKQIYDPINNDIVPSDDKNIPFENLNLLFDTLDPQKGNIVSIHPHRWSNSVFLQAVKKGVFKWVKKTAKILMRIPALKKIMSQYYYLAKKI